MMQSILLLGRSGCMLSQEMFYFRLCEVTSGGLWGPKRLVAEVFLRVEIWSEI